MPIITAFAWVRNWGDRLLLRFALPVLLTFVLFALTLFLVFLPRYEASLLQDKRDTSRELTRVAISLLHQYQRQVEQGERTLEEAQRRAKLILYNLRFGPENLDYYWVNDMNCVMLVHPYRPDLEGKSVSDFQDPDGNYIFQLFVDTAREYGGGHVEYTWQRYGDMSQLSRKTSYVEAFEPWGWVVGTGLYLDDTMEVIRATTNRLYRMCLGIVFLVGSVLAYVLWQVRSVENQRRATEQALSTSEAKYRGVFETANDGIMLIDEDRVVECNDRIPEMLACTREEVIGKSPSDLSPEFQPDGTRTVDAQASQIRQVLAGKQLRFEWIARRKTGERFHVEVSLNRVEMSGRLHVQAFVRDISDRKKAEAERTRLATAIEHSAEGIIITDNAGIIQYVNACFERDTGYNREEVCGQSTAILGGSREDPAFAQDLWGTIMAGRVWTGRMKNRRKDGSLFDAYGIVSPIPDASGRLLGFVAVERDITEQIRAEAVAQQSQKLEALGTLAAGIAHDFNNALSVITGFAELARQECPPDSMSVHFLSEILKTAQKSAQLVRQILTFSRKTPSTRRPLHLNEILEETVAMLRRSIPAHIEIRTHVPPEIPLVAGDPIQLHQVIMNLCTNAYHAMDEKGGCITISLCCLERAAAQGTNAVETRPNVCLSVKDTGHGMDEATKQRIFEPFFTTKPEGRGTGMGLATVHGIVKNHEGEIEVESAPGKGSVFRVYLPVYAGVEQQLASSDSGTPPPRGNGEHIMVIDDNPAILETSRRLLIFLGYDAHAFSSPDAAFDVFHSDPAQISVVITDSSMPEMSGLAFARRIRELRTDIPIIMVTGLCTEDIMEEAVASGIKRVVAKPITLQELAISLRDLLREQNNS